MKVDFKQILHFIDNNILLGLSLFLLVFIPLFPKWPLFDVLPGYNVRVRLEDFLILITCLIFIVQIFRRKISLKKHPLSKAVLAYLVVGLLSSISAILIINTVPQEPYHILKIFFHFFRRIEYFSLLFIFYFALKSRDQIKYFLVFLILAVTGVTIYGFGQKYMYWPAYSTMNREFSKGIVLYLTEHARVLSTFGGHYDLAAYTMITLSLLIPLAFIVKNRLLKLLLFIVSLAEYWLLNLTASRTSFIAYIASLTLIFFLLAWKKGWWWAVWRWASVMLVSFAVMLTIGPMSERFSHIVKLDGVKNFFHNSFKKEPPANGIAYREDLSIEQQLEIVADETDIPPSAERPADVYIDQPTPTPLLLTAENLEASKSATVSAKTGGGYSENALKYGLSTGIRLDALWPRAIAGFKKNPLLGSGYSTLVKEKVWEQTTAESTDNDFLRLLGETGLLGFVFFMAIFGISVKILFNAFRKTDDIFFAALYACGLGIIVGLMVNALYIDIFESSKVAYTMWSVLGVLLAAAVIQPKKSVKIKAKM